MPFSPSAVDVCASRTLATAASATRVHCENGKFSERYETPIRLFRRPGGYWWRFTLRHDAKLTDRAKRAKNPQLPSSALKIREVRRFELSVLNARG